MKIRKPIFAVLILLILTLILGFVIMIGNAGVEGRQADVRNTMKAKNMIRSLKVIESEVNNTYDSMKQKTDAWIKLLVSALRTYVNDGEYSGARVFDDGMVVQVRGDRIG